MIYAGASYSTGLHTYFVKHAEKAANRREMAHKIEAGSDFFLMPSQFEPCGLNQMYGLRYGCMPIVRSTGGLKDTVVDIGDGGFGIRHENTSVEDVVYSIGRAVQHFENQKESENIQETMMQLDHSWENSAGMYVSLYEQLNTQDDE